MISVFFLPTLSKSAMDNLKKESNACPINVFLLMLKDWPQITGMEFFSLVAIHKACDIPLRTVC